MPATTTTPLPASLLSLRQLSVRLNRSLASLGRDLALGRLPEGVRIGRSRRWCPHEIESWLAAGCPRREVWEAMRQADNKRRA